MGNILNLVGLIYDASADASRWHLFLNAYVQAVGGRRSLMIVNAERGRKPALFRSSDWPDEDFHRSAKRSIAADWCKAVANGHPEGAIRIINDLRSAEPAIKSADQRGSDSPTDVHCALSGVFLRTAHGSSTIVAMRGQQDGPFGAPAVAILRPLMAHLRRAALLQSELISLRVQLAVFNVYLDRHPHPILLTDAGGRFIYANAAAHEIVRLKDGLVLTAGQISLTSLHKQAAFLKALGEAATGRGASLCWLEVARPANKPPYRLLLMPVPHEHDIPPEFSHGGNAVLMLLIADSEPGPELDPTMLRVLFSLTQTEARVAGKLAAGRSVEEIALEMGVSVETVRTHVRRILSKTSTGRQGEFISLVHRTTPFRSF